VRRGDLKRLAELTLILRSQLGDDSAFERLLGKYQRPLHYFVAQLTGSNGAADDAPQEVWVTVYRKIATLRQPERFRVWPYSIARHKAYHAIRKPSRAPLPENGEIAGPEEDVNPFEGYDAARVRQALSRLQPQHREVLLLRFFEGMSYADIAGTMPWPVGTVRSRLNISKKRLREHLDRTGSHE